MRKGKTAALIAASFIALAGCSSTPTFSPTGDEQSVYSVCHDATEQQLKSPKSVDYSSETAFIHKTTDTGAEWKAVGTLKALNSLGVYATGSYVCEVVYTQETGTYQATADVNG